MGALAARTITADHRRPSHQDPSPQSSPLLLYIQHMQLIINGQSREFAALSASATVADLVDRLIGEFPNAGAALRLARYAVNRDYLPATTVLHAGDEVAFIPPVAGGGA